MSTPAVHLPPGPTGRLATTGSIIRRPFEWYADTLLRYGRTFSARTLNGDMVITGDPALARQIFALNEEHIRPFAAGALGPAIGNGSVLLQHGDPHRRSRSTLMPAFAGERMRAYGARIRAITREEMATWPALGEMSLQDGMMRISLRVIVEVVFGARTDDEVDRLIRSTETLVATMRPSLFFTSALQVRFLGISPWDRFLAARAAFSEEVLAVARSRRAGTSTGDDILTVLLDTRDEDDGTFSETELVDQLVTLLVAGHETSAISMAWAMDWVHRTPGCLEAVRGSLADVPEVDGVRNPSDSGELARVVRETLRLWPIVTEVLRTLKQPLTLGEWHLPAGHSVAVATALIHADPELYPEPHAFRPDRFRSFQPRPWEYLPFGGGIRRCIGAAFATHEMQQVLGVLLDGLDVRLASPTPAKPVRRSITMAPSEGVRARCALRAQADRELVGQEDGRLA